MPRRPKPNHLHVVQGTGRADRHSLENGPSAPSPVTLDPPDHLSLIAVELWRRLAPVLDGMGVLSSIDGIAFERMCECYAEIRACQAVLLVEGDTYETTTVVGGRMIRGRPEKAMMADADRRLRTYLSEFGLTPAARTKIKVQIGGKKGDPLEAYFG